MKQALSNTEILMFIIGWQGGTIGQLASAMGVPDRRILNADYDDMQDLMRLAQQKRAAQSNSGWMPIESAPRDGTEVIVYLADKHGLRSFIASCSYHEDAGWCADELRDVTHWMPLPQAPRAAESAGKGGV